MHKQHLGFSKKRNNPDAISRSCAPSETMIRNTTVRGAVSGQCVGFYFGSPQSGNGHMQRVWMTCWSSELLLESPTTVRMGDEQGKQLV